MRELSGAGLSGDDSGLNDVFEEWADQLAFEHSIFFDLFDDLAWQICEEVSGTLGQLETSVLAAFSESFGEHSCTREFINDASLDHFHEHSAVANELYKATRTFAVNFAEDLFHGD